MRMRVAPRGACRHRVRMGDARRPQVRVAMIDHEAAFVDCVMRYCARSEPTVAIAHIKDLAELRLRSRWSRPDVVTLDPDQLDDPVADVLETIALPTRPSVIALTMASDSAVVADCVRAGAVGWVGKQEPITALVDAIRAVARGEARFPPEHLGVVMRTLARQARSVPVSHCARGRTLTMREQEILAMLIDGATPHEIAQRLRLSTNTIRSHRRRIEAKLGVHG